MAKWDIDKALQALEPDNAPGTILQRALMDTSIMESKGVIPTPEQRERGFGNVWCVGLGIVGMPKAFFYGQTIREALLRARKAAKSGSFAKHTPWGVQNFQPDLKPKKKDRRDKQKKKRARSVTVP